MYEAEASGRRLRLQGRGGLSDTPPWLSSTPLSTVSEPAARGEAKLYLYTEDGRASLFPPVRTSALQPILDDLLTAVRLRVDGPHAEDFARRYLGEA